VDLVNDDVRVALEEGVRSKASQEESRRQEGEASHGTGPAFASHSVADSLPELLAPLGGHAFGEGKARDASWLGTDDTAVLWMAIAAHPARLQKELRQLCRLATTSFP